MNVSMPTVVIRPGRRRRSPGRAPRSPPAEAVGLDPVAQGQRAQRRYQGPVPADTRLTMPSWAKWFTPRVAPSPWPAAKTSVRSRGSPVSRKRRSRARASSSGSRCRRTGGGDRVPGEHQSGRRVRGDDLVPAHRSPPRPSRTRRTRARPTISPRSRPRRPRRVLQRRRVLDMGVDGEAPASTSRIGGHVGAGSAAVGPDQADRAGHRGGPSRPRRWPRRRRCPRRPWSRPRAPSPGLLEVCGRPRASKATSTPSAPVGSRIRSTGCVAQLSRYQCRPSAWRRPVSPVRGRRGELHRAERPRHLHEFCPTAEATTATGSAGQRGAVRNRP